MSFLTDINFDDVVEPRAVDADKEYKIRIVDVKEGTDKNGNPYALPRLEILDELGAKDFTYFLGRPNPDTMDAKQINSAKHKIKTFLEAFDIDSSADPSDWVGSESWAILGMKEDEQYGEQNFVKKFVKG